MFALRRGYFRSSPLERRPSRSYRISSRPKGAAEQRNGTADRRPSHPNWRLQLRFFASLKVGITELAYLIAHSAGTTRAASSPPAETRCRGMSGETDQKYLAHLDLSLPSPTGLPVSVSRGTLIVVVVEWQLMWTHDENPTAVKATTHRRNATDAGRHNAAAPPPLRLPQHVKASCTATQIRALGCMKTTWPPSSFLY